MELIGYLGHSLSDFSLLEPREIVKIIEISRKRVQTEHRLHYIATLNAIGACLGGQDFDYIDVFASSSSENETYTDDEVEFLRNNF